MDHLALMKDADKYASICEHVNCDNYRTHIIVYGYNFRTISGEQVADALSTIPLNTCLYIYFIFQFKRMLNRNILESLNIL